MPLEKIKVTYETDHKCKLEDDFEWFEEKAIGAASLAQVHRAKYRKSGEIMAVKIQYPQLRMQTWLDLWVIRKLTKVANRLCRWYEYRGLDFTKFLNHFEKGLKQELDFKTEVINSQRTVENFKANEDDRVYVPKVDVLKSTKRTILMEYVEGVKIDDIEGLKREFGDAKRCTDLLVEVFARMIF